MVRQRSAKPLFIGSIPIAASKNPSSIESIVLSKHKKLKNEEVVLNWIRGTGDIGRRSSFDVATELRSCVVVFSGRSDDAVSCPG